MTQHNDLSRTGQNLSETILTPSSVSSGNFGKLFTLTVDGVVEAQPLFMPGVLIGGVTHNIVFVATEHDSVYAFDADAGGTALWQVSLFDSAHGASAGASSDPQAESGCFITDQEYGISGTPVIDPVTATLYVVSVTLENNYPLYRLHALDITTGNEKAGSPAVITASVAGTGAGSSNGMLTFDPNLENQRAGLALVNGSVYVAFGSNCDWSNFHGWFFSYDAATLAQKGVFLTTPNGIESGIWMGAAAPAVDTENGLNRMFITTGNGTYDATAPYGANSMDYGDDVLRLDISSGIQVADAFTPLNQNQLETGDLDLGSSGTMILPDQSGAYPHLLLEASKGGVIYLLNRDNLGGYNSTRNQVVQELDGVVAGSYGLPAYWNGNVYLWPSKGQLEQFTLSSGVLSSLPVAVSSWMQVKGVGSTPSISANGAANGIVWSIDAGQFPQVLYAHDATNVANMLWNSGINSTRDSAGLGLSFSVPTIVNGKVFVGSVKQVSVYGMLPAPQTITFSPIGTQVLGVPLTLGASASSGLAVSYASTTGTVCTVSGVTATFVAAGVCTITATQAGDSQYAPAPSVSQSCLVAMPAPSITNVSVTAVSSGSVVINWTTNQPSSSQVNYGGSLAYGSTTALNATLVTSHTVLVSGLAASTTYNFDVVSSNAGNISATSGNGTFTTLASTGPAPYVGYVAYWGVTNSGITVSWSTNVPANTFLAYGTTPALGQVSAVQTALTAGHGVVLSGLTSGTTYYFAAESTGANGATGQSSIYSFTTTGMAPSVAPVISNVVVSGVTSSSAVISWTTDQPSSSQVNYGTSIAYGSTTALASALVTSHSVTLSGLTAGTSYSFDVVSSNSAGLTTTSINYTFTTMNTTVVAPVITSVAVTGLTGSSAVISWTTDQPSSSQVKYGLSTSYGLTTTLNAALVTNHTVTLTALSTGTSYDFEVSSANSTGLTATSTNSTFTTTSVTVVAPVISNVTTNVTSSSAVISWTTDQPSSSQVNYGTSAAYGSMTTLDPTLVTSHSVVVSGLAAGTTYDFDVVSSNASGISSTFANGTLTTLASTGPAPYVGYVAFWGINNSGITISWSTDVPANTVLAYGTTPALGQLSPVQAVLTVSHGVVLTGLSSGTTYYFVAESTGADGVMGQSTTYSFTTTGMASAAAPVISSVTATSVTGNSATISWTTDQPSSSQVNFGTSTSYGSTTTLNSTLVTNHVVALSGLTVGTNYDFEVISTDSAALTSTSVNYTFATTSQTVSAPVISNLTAAAVTSNSAVISWTTDQPASSQVNYGMSTAYGLMTTLDPTLVTSHSVTLSGLAASTMYDFDVVSSDSGGISATSVNETLMTVASTGPAPYVGYVAFWGITSSGITISWSTDVPANTMVAYGTTPALGQMSPVQTALTASHGVVLTGLASGTTYYFVPESVDANGVVGRSGTTYTFTTTK